MRNSEKAVAMAAAAGLGIDSAVACGAPAPAAAGVVFALATSLVLSHDEARAFIERTVIGRGHRRRRRAFTLLALLFLALVASIPPGMLVLHQRAQMFSWALFASTMAACAAWAIVSAQVHRSEPEVLLDVEQHLRDIEKRPHMFVRGMLVNPALFLTGYGASLCLACAVLSLPNLDGMHVVISVCSAALAWCGVQLRHANGWSGA